MRKPDSTPDDQQERPGESFLQRFHRRKLEARGLTVSPENRPSPVQETAALSDAAAARPRPELTDDDMPALESLDEESDYTGFLSAKVSESLRRAALRKLFHSSAFNVIDDLDDYAEDFTTFEALGDLITADMRHRLDVEARRQAERLQPDDAGSAPTGCDIAGESPRAAPTAPDDDTESELTPTLADATSPGTSTPPAAETETHAERPADT